MRKLFKFLARGSTTSSGSSSRRNSAAANPIPEDLHLSGPLTPHSSLSGPDVLLLDDGSTPALESLLRGRIRRAQIGSTEDLKAVLDVLFVLDDILPEKTQEKLAAYLSHDRSVYKMILLLTSDKEDADELEFVHSIREVHKYKYVISCFILYGPEHVRQKIASSAPLLDPILAFLASPSPKDTVILEFAARVLGCLLHENSTFTVSHMAAAQSGRFIPRVVQRIGSKAVAELLARLVSEHGFFNLEPLLFGPVNRFGVDLLHTSRLPDLLEARFVDAVETEVFAYETVCAAENCADTLAKVTLRAAMGEAAVAETGMGGARYNDYFAFALRALNTVRNPRGHGRMLDAAIAVGTPWAVGAAVGAVVTIMEEIERARATGSPAVRLVVRQVRTGALENVLAERFGGLVGLVRGCETPLKMDKFLVVKLLSLCFRMGSAETMKKLVGLGVHKVMMELFVRHENNALLQREVRLAIASALAKDFIDFHEAWINDCDLISFVLSAWLDFRGKPKPGYFQELMEIGLSIGNFIKRRQLILGKEDDQFIPIDKKDLFQKYSQGPLELFQRSRAQPLLFKPVGMPDMLGKKAEVFDEDEGEALYIMTRLTEKLLGDDDEFEDEGNAIVTEERAKKL